MITYLEYSRKVVDAYMAPAELCYVKDAISNNRRCFEYLSMAERVYLIEGNVLTEIKNRRCEVSKMHISDEDRVVLKLKAVLI